MPSNVAVTSVFLVLEMFDRKRNYRKPMPFRDARTIKNLCKAKHILRSSPRSYQVKTPSEPHYPVCEELAAVKNTRRLH